MTTPLPLPDDPALDELRTLGLTLYQGRMFPRSAWLHDFEAVLRWHYPHSTSKQRTLTARLAAPFPLAKPGVP